MRLSFFATVSLVTGTLPTDPCWFIGYRLAKSYSKCLDGVCVGIRLANGMFALAEFAEEISEARQVSCDEAQTVVDEYNSGIALLGEQRPRRGVSVLPTDLKSSLQEIGEVIVPAVRQTLFSRRRITESVFALMKSIDELLRTHFKSNPDWSLIRESYLKATEFKEFMSLLHLTQQWSDWVPYSVDVLPGLMADFIHFSFDLISVLGDPFKESDVHWNRLTVFTIVASCKPVQYRPEAEAELNTDCDMEYTTDVVAALETAAAMAKLRTDPTDPQAIFSVSKFVSRLPYGVNIPQTASVAMLRHQLYRELCPRVLNLIRDSSLWAEYKKSAVSLIHNCRDYMPFDNIVASSIVLLATGIRPQALIAGEPEKLLEGLCDERFAWIEGFESTFTLTIPVITHLVSKFLKTHRPFIKRDDVSVLRPRNKFQSGTKFESVMKGLGRLLGLCARYRVNCMPYLGVSEGLLYGILGQWGSRSLLTSIRAPRHELTTLDQVAKYLEENVHEPAFFISLGIRDVLGPVGIYAIDNPARFGSFRL